MTDKKRALITGVTGQDGSYLAEFLLEKGYEVHGIKRRASSFNTQRVDHIYEGPNIENQNFALHYGDLTDSSNLTRILSDVRPHEVYNLGAQSHVAVSFESPEYTADVDAMGTLRLLEAMRFGYGEYFALLPSLHIRTVWSGPRGAPTGDNAILSQVAIRCSQAICLLDRGKLPRIIWNVRMQWHSFQS